MRSTRHALQQRVLAHSSYREHFLGVLVTHAAELDQGPECGVVEVVDVAWTVSENMHGTTPLRAKKYSQSACRQLM